jgi:hypothetical protein
LYWDLSEGACALTPGEQQAKSWVYSPRTLRVVKTTFGTFGVFDSKWQWMGEFDEAGLMEVLDLASKAELTSEPAASREAPIQAELEF